MSLINYQKTFSFFKKMAVAVTVVLVCCMLHACSQDTEAYSEGQKSRVRVELSAFHFDVASKGYLSRGALSDAVTRLSFAVYDADGNLSEEVVHQNSTQTDFGTFSLELYPGTYKMVAVAHNGSADASISSATSVTLPGTTFTDTFAKVEEFTVNSGQDCSLKVELPRVTSAFILRLSDDAPEEADRIEVVLNSAGLTYNSLDFNPTTGLAANNWKQTVSIPIADFENDVPVYFIGMVSPTTVTVKATAYDADGTAIISHTLSNVQLYPNRKTIATGNFFIPKVTGTFTITTTWGDDNTVEY